MQLFDFGLYGSLIHSVCLMRFLFVGSEICHRFPSRFRVAADTLGLGYTLPATGRVRGFHPLDYAHAGRTCPFLFFDFYR